MTYFPDLSRYTYMERSGMVLGITPLNIGWLGGGEPFPTDTIGWPDQVFLDNLALFEQKEYHVNLTRGWHVCELCEEDEDEEELLKEGKLCHDELRVLGLDGVVYAAPSMLRHYITVHQYRPPEVFIQAVLQGPRPSSPAYGQARVLSSWE